MIVSLYNAQGEQKACQNVRIDALRVTQEGNHIIVADKARLVIGLTAAEIERLSAASILSELAGTLEHFDD